MDPVNNSRILRWGVLIAVLLDIAVNVLSNYFLINGHTIAEITQHYQNLFTPAGFTFSIWGVIYLSYLVYAVYQLLPAQKYNHVYDEMAPAFILINVLGVLWLFVFSYELITLSIFVIAGMLVTAFVVFRKAKQSIEKHLCPKAISIPFSLIFGWISVATLANSAAWFVFMGWDGTVAEESTRTVVMIFIAMLAAFLVSWIYRDWIYPLVVAWACLGIWSANRELNEMVATCAIITGGILLAWDVIFSIVKLSNKREKLV